MDKKNLLVGEFMKKIGILKEIINGENRVILLPKDVREIAKKYEVFVESDAGLNLGYTNDDYIKYGAKIADREYC